MMPPPSGLPTSLLSPGLPLSYRVNGVLFHKGERLMPDSTEAFIRQIYDLTRSHTIDTFLKNGDDDFSFSIPGLSRFRVSTYKQRGSLAAVIRVITFELPNPTQLGFPMPSWPFPNTPKAWFSSPAGRKRKIHDAGLPGRPDQHHQAGPHHHSGGPPRIPAPP